MLEDGISPNDTAINLRNCLGAGETQSGSSERSVERPSEVLSALRQGGILVEG